MVFVPVGFIPGIVGRLYQQFAITIAISVILSAFIALSLTPALCTMLLKPTRSEQKRRKGSANYSNALTTGSIRSPKDIKMGWTKSIKGFRWIIVLLLVICIGTWLLFREKAYRLYSASEDDGNLYVTFQLPPASSTAASVDVMNKLMKVVTETPGVAHYAALSGLNVVNNATNSNAGTIYGTAKALGGSKHRRPAGPWYHRRTEHKDPGRRDPKCQCAGNPTLSYPRRRRNGRFQPADADQRSTNDDFHAFQQVVNKFIAEANRNPAISGAFSFYSANTPSFNLKVDRDKCEN